MLALNLGVVKSSAMGAMICQRALSFRNAFAGVFWAFKTQPNMFIHLLATFAVAAAGFYFKISRGEWLILILTIALVFTAEMVNTAIEVITDYFKLKKLTEKEDLFIMVAKDIGAGAVLLAALSAAIIGLLVFGPHFF